MATKQNKTAELLEKHEDSVVLYRAGESVKGSVIDANPSRILLDLPGGTTGMITKKEATGYGVDGNDFDEGETLEAMVIEAENDEGLVLLSLRRASQDMAWAELGEVMQDARIIKVKIDEANKGGLMAKYKGLKAFLPVSQLTPVNYPRVNGADTSKILNKLQEHVGKEFVVRVINVDREEEKIILSEKAAYKEQATDTLQTLEVGDRVKGEVSGIVKFGIFVTFGGVEGLVHLSEMDWGHVSNPGEHYSLGDKVEVLVIGMDGDKLSFSIKRLQEDPWLSVVKEYEPGQEVSGKVLRWNSQGVFIELKEDVQGFFTLGQFGVEDHGDLNIRDGEEMKGIIDQINQDAHRVELRRPEDASSTPAPKKKKASAPDEKEEDDEEDTPEKKKKTATKKAKSTTKKDSAKKETPSKDEE